MHLDLPLSINKQQHNSAVLKLFRNIIAFLIWGKIKYGNVVLCWAVDAMFRAKAVRKQHWYCIIDTTVEHIEMIWASLSA